MEQELKEKEYFEEYFAKDIERAKISNDFLKYMKGRCYWDLSREE